MPLWPFSDFGLPSLSRVLTSLSSKLLLLEREGSGEQSKSSLEVDDTRNAFCIPSCLKSSSTGCCCCQKKELVFMPGSSALVRSLVHYMYSGTYCPTFSHHVLKMTFRISDGPLNTDASAERLWYLGEPVSVQRGTILFLPDWSRKFCKQKLGRVDIKV